jgi:hypothetical protein
VFLTCFQPKNAVQPASTINPKDASYRKTKKNDLQGGRSNVRVFSTQQLGKSSHQQTEDFILETENDLGGGGVRFRRVLALNSRSAHCTLNSHNKTQTHEKTDERTGQPLALFIAKR